jgi:hypothetical protein
MSRPVSPGDRIPLRSAADAFGVSIVPAREVRGRSSSPAILGRRDATRGIPEGGAGAV